MQWTLQQSNLFIQLSRPVAKFAIAVLLGSVSCLGTSLAADDASQDFSALIRALNDFRSSVEHDFTLQREVFSDFSEGIEQRLQYPIYTTFTDYIESPADITLDDLYRGIHSQPESYGLGPEWSESGPYPERYERYLINLIGKTYDNTYVSQSGGLPPATWDTYGYGIEGVNTPADNWTNRVGRLWTSLPAIYRKNNVAGWGLGSPKSSSSSSVNWGANTSLPAEISSTYSPEQTIVGLLMRMAAEQHAFNSWVSYGGLLANLPFDYSDRRHVTNLVRGSALQIPIFEEPMNDKVYPFSTVDGDDNSGYGVSFAEYLRLRNLQTMVPLTVANEYFNQEDNLNIVSTDPVFYSLIDHFHDSSFINSRDQAYNPDGVMTNLPLLYHEDTFSPQAWQEAAIPPSLDQYAALQRIRIINRLSLLAFAFTNQYSTVSSSNSILDAVGFKSDFSTNSTQFISDDVSSQISSSVQSLNAISNSISEVQSSLSPFLQNTSDSASIDFSLRFHDTDLPNFNVSFDLPTLGDGEDGKFLKTLSNMIGWSYRLSFFFFVIWYARRTYFKILSTLGVPHSDSSDDASVPLDNPME